MKLKVWHYAYRTWRDHYEAGHAKRAAVWGWTADRIAERL